MDRTACTEPQCLYSTAISCFCLYLLIFFPVCFNSWACPFIADDACASVFLWTVTCRSVCTSEYVWNDVCRAPLAVMKLAPEWSSLFSPNVIQQQQRTADALGLSRCLGVPCWCSNVTGPLVKLRGFYWYCYYHYYYYLLQLGWHSAATVFILLDTKQMTIYIYIYM